jgi:hypothetical protein
MDFPGAHNVRRRPQGLGVARDVRSPRIGDLSVHRTPGVSRSQIDIWDGNGSRWCSVLAKVDCCGTALQPHVLTR